MPTLLWKILGKCHRTIEKKAKGLQLIETLNYFRWYILNYNLNFLKSLWQERPPCLFPAWSRKIHWWWMTNTVDKLQILKIDYKYIYWMKIIEIGWQLLKLITNIKVDGLPNTEPFWPVKVWSLLGKQTGGKLVVSTILPAKR